MTPSDKYLLFRLEKVLFGVHILEVSEILGQIQLTPVPQSPSYIAGMMTVRGEPLIIMDLRKRFHFASRDPDLNSRVVVVKEQVGERLGLLVDAVQEIVRITGDTIREPGELIHQVGIEKRYLRGVAILREQPLFVIDTLQLLSGEETELKRAA